MAKRLAKFYCPAMFLLLPLFGVHRKIEGVNKFSITFLIALAALRVCAQDSTNPPSPKVITNAVAKTNTQKRYKPPAIPAHIITLNRITTQIDANKAELERVDNRLHVLAQAQSLQSSAGKKDPATQNEVAKLVKYRAQLERGLATLRLEEFNIRQTYGIPDPKKEPVKKTR